MSLNDRQITASALQGMIVPFATVRHSNLRRPERLCALRDHRQRHPRRGGLAAQRGLFDSLHEKTFACQALGGGVEVASGIYCFHMEIDGEPFSFEARFSYAVSLGLPAPILHHH